MNDARNMDNNHTSGLFMNQSGTSLKQFEVGPEDEILIMVYEDGGDVAGTDREGGVVFNISYKGNIGKA